METVSEVKAAGAVEQGGNALVPTEGQPATRENESLQGEVDAGTRLQPIVPNTIMSYSAAGFIHVNRNATTFVSMAKMTAAQINLLIAIIESIKSYTVYGNSYPFKDTHEVEVKIHWDVISCGHHPKVTEDSLISLSDIKLVYSYAFKGMGRTGVANIVSSIEYCDGYYYVQIPSKALPWYLYCGQKVGFARIERHVLYAIRSVPEKLLYLKLMSVVDREKKVGYWEASASELRDVMNLGDRTTISRMISRFIRPLVDDMTHYRSVYSIEANPSKDTHHKGKGHPSFKGVMFTVMNSREPSEGLFETAMYVLRECYKIWTSSGKGKVMPANMIVYNLENGEQLNAFVSKCERVSEVIRKKVEKKGNGDTQQYRLQMASTVAKILREDYEIEVFEIKKH